MEGTVEKDPKRRLLDTVIDYVARHGTSDLTLRGLASAIGTSHRMLIYHFGSREGLLTEVIQTVEARERRALADLVRELDDKAPEEAIRLFWRQLTDPARLPQKRLYFEMYGQALQGRPGTTHLLDGAIEAWLEPLAEWSRRAGLPPEKAQANARLGLAVARGLVLDLLHTGDRRAVEAAVEHFLDLVMRDIRPEA
ncbi:TetR family transcriptional regulator [Nonomuraea sp. NPDC052116]|uniref:TetR/AcrR family transcriptional regulator n=1 Tax=Nonomuraea sp. NPDC052116 TaxID=3155665 RepID=UPI00342BE3DD